MKDMYLAASAYPAKKLFLTNKNRIHNAIIPVTLKHHKPSLMALENSFLQHIHKNINANMIANAKLIL